ncbi:cytochrome P450 [Xylariaceae sp. FL0804]|nr:cytochrome P450 [Xylariaceae sp. FL0804]
MELLRGSAILWVVLVSTLVCYQLFIRASKIRRNGTPLRIPPNTLPLVGNGILFLRARQELFSWFVKCERKFGYETFQITVPTLQPGVVINDPRNLDYVFKNEGIFAKGNFVKRRSWDLFGHGIINADGELWKIQRKAGLHFLNTMNLRVLTEVALPTYLSRSVSLLRERARDGRLVDLQSVFHEITSQLMGKMAYGMEMHADDEFTVAFDYASGVTTERFQNPFWMATEWITGLRFRRSLATIRAFGINIVKSAAAQAPGQDSSVEYDPADDTGRLHEVSGSLIKSLLQALGSQKDIVADAALNYLSAGRDTTAQALSWTMYSLMRHRFVAGKLRNEVQHLLESSPDSAMGDCFGEDRINSTLFNPSALPYTMAVFYESLRLYPPIPFEIKECEKATTLPDGTFLPQGSVVVWCPWAMNRSKMTWGDDADSFRPERWLDQDGRLVNKSASEFPVFNGGPRTCLGKRMAEIIAAQAIATMVLMFDFMPAYEGERVSKSSLTLPMKDGLPCYVRIRAGHTI